MKIERRDFEKAFIFAVLFATLACVSIGTVSAAQTHYVNPGESIQAAVDAADPGDTIVVRDGTYTENINVYKGLTIKSENGSENCIVLAENTNDHVFKVTTWKGSHHRVPFHFKYGRFTPSSTLTAMKWL